MHPTINKDFEIMLACRLSHVIQKSWNFNTKADLNLSGTNLTQWEMTSAIVTTTISKYKDVTMVISKYYMLSIYKKDNIINITDWRFKYFKNIFNIQLRKKKYCKEWCGIIITYNEFDYKLNDFSKIYLTFHNFYVCVTYKPS